MIVSLAELKPAERQAYLQHAIAPRPVCFASTIDKAGNVNLSPFSFFNLFSSNPPVVIFSPSRRVRDNTTKHTLENVLEVPEVVINIVDYEMVQQTSLASCEYPKAINEFLKSGLTAEPATLVQPPMVKESKIKLECKVLEVKALGTEGGAGNLVIAEVLRMHIEDAILDEKGMIDHHKIQHIARLGGDWYSVVNASSLFSVAKPNVHLGIGFDALPESIRNSTVLTGNQLAQLANVHELPVADPTFMDDTVRNIVQYYSLNPDDMEKELHRHAASLLKEDKVAAAWQVLLVGE
ncbi:flavin reductase family protein [Filimonas effusa]|uniref:Flavin reductase family protein n=1 Tax=Filimonas effusa TaxID=2508721 RepID=A0A4Q1CZS8_9BACT|nr:flavin reductase family protein [Filimonas effusa]RXK80918.1 flavin reductase family protein [Filimonas effusa]